MVSFAMSPKENNLLCSLNNGQLKFYDIDTKKCRHTLQTLHIPFDQVSCALNPSVEENERIFRLKSGTLTVKLLQRLLIWCFVHPQPSG